MVVVWSDGAGRPAALLSQSGTRDEDRGDRGHHETSVRTQTATATVLELYLEEYWPRNVVVSKDGGGRLRLDCWVSELWQLWELWPKRSKSGHPMCVFLIMPYISYMMMDKSTDFKTNH